MVIAAQVRYSVEAGLLLLAACVLIGPLLAERFRIPGLLGLIAAGTALGPYVLDWLRPGGFVATLGAAGLLYLMFMAGVELDLNAIRANRRAALVLGLLTFAIPFSLSYLVGRYHLGLGLSATALVGAMWASHTLVAYPEVKTAGIDRSRAVGVSLAATVITDVASLVVLAIAASSTALVEAPEVAGQLAAGTLETSTVLPLWAGLPLMTVVCFGVIPWSTRWMYAHVLLRRTERFVWVLAAMAVGAISGVLGGIEGMVGAFLAGIGMNPSIPARSELMERIEFIGSALLVPAFLVSVGLSIDPSALADPSTLALAGIFTLVVVAGKLGAAVAAGLLFRFERGEIALMTTLTIGQAAATLAIAQVGLRIGLIDDRVMGAAFVTVAATAFITSIGTRLAARRFHGGDADESRLGDHVLVLAPSPAVPLREFAMLASAMVGDDGGVVTPFAVRTARRRDPGGTERLHQLDRSLVQLGHDTRTVHRVADTLENGIAHLADEFSATLLVIPFTPDHVVTRLASDIERFMAVSDVPVVVIVPATTAWQRVVLVTADGESDDSRIAHGVAAKAAKARSSVVSVVRPSEEPPGRSGSGNDAAEGPVKVPGHSLPPLRPGDLVVLPATALSEMLRADPDGLRTRIDGVSIAVVAVPAPLRSAQPSTTLHRRDPAPPGSSADVVPA